MPWRFHTVRVPDSTMLSGLTSIALNSVSLTMEGDMEYSTTRVA